MKYIYIYRTAQNNIKNCRESKWTTIRNNTTQNEKRKNTKLQDIHKEGKGEVYSWTEKRFSMSLKHWRG